ncbi:hypothetical protein F5146DRAFT_62065 [Armillaria mellea]|nr:hypothetical protein F5146DRAFT_62065 [Armillaria mellea]
MCVCVCVCALTIGLGFFFIFGRPLTQVSMLLLSSRWKCQSQSPTRGLPGWVIHYSPTLGPVKCKKSNPQGRPTGPRKRCNNNGPTSTHHCPKYDNPLSPPGSAV